MFKEKLYTFMLLDVQRGRITQQTMLFCAELLHKYLSFGVIYKQVEKGHFSPEKLQRNWG